MKRLLALLGDEALRIGENRIGLVRRRDEDRGLQMQTHMPPSLTARWDYLYNEVIALHYRWNVYRQLFAKSPERIELLNECASSFFYVLHDTFLIDVQLGISKLADPSRSGNNENLTLETLLKAVENELQDENSLRADLRGLLDRYRELSSRIRHRRNKQIAHRDLSSSLSPIDGPSREEIENALAALRDFMNAIESHFNHSTTAYRCFLSGPDGDALIFVLKQALRYAELQNQGVIPWDDFQKSPFRDA